jgi:GTP-binding protein
VRPNTAITVIDRDGGKRPARVAQVLGFIGLERRAVTEAKAGDIVAVTGIEAIRSSDTLCGPRRVES